MDKRTPLVKLHFVFMAALFVLMGCVENKTTLEEELSDLKKRAYDINYQFVNEASIVSLLAKKLIAKPQTKTIVYHSPESISENYGFETTEPTGSGIRLPVFIDTVLKRNKSEFIFASRLVFGLGSEYYFYPKMNTKFLNLEESDFDYDRQIESDSLNSFVNPWRLTPVYHPLDESIVIRYIEYADAEKNIFAAAHFSIKKVFDTFLKSAEGTFMLIDQEGHVIAMSDDAYYITGFRKPKHIYRTADELRNEDMQEFQTIYNSANESFRRNVFEIVKGGNKRSTFKHSGKEYTLISSSIKQIKWELIRIL